MTLRVFEAFSGIGTQRMALRNLGVDHEVVAISEIDKYAIKSYEAIHGEVNNLGDISQVDIKDIPEHDLFTYSFPCQDISVSGKKKGLSKGSGTRSSLLWEANRIIEHKRPKYLLMENVKNLLSKRFKGDFLDWLEHLTALGYTNYWQVLNAKDYNVPQNRERVFCVSVLDEHASYHFPETVPLEYRLKDILLSDVPSKFYLTNDKTKELIKSIPYHKLIAILNDVSYGDEKEPTIKQVGNTTPRPKRSNPQTGRTYHPNGLSPALNTMQGGSRQPQVLLPPYAIGASRGRYINNTADKPADKITKQQLEINGTEATNTLTTVQKDNYVLQLFDYRIRKLTPQECWRLMGCTDEDFFKAEAVNSNTQLYKQAGNAIVVDVLMAIFRELLVNKQPKEGES